MTDATNFRRERIEKLLHELRYEAALVMWAANSAVYELSYPEARADSLRQVAEEIDCGGGCDKHCGPHTFDRGDFCGFAAAEDLRKLANALDLKAKVDAEGLAAQTPPDRRALTMIAAECHRAKWQFDIDDEEPPKAAAARVLVDLAFKTLHRIGDMALNLRNGSVVPSTDGNTP